MGTIRFTLRTDKADKSFKSPIEVVYQISGQRKYVLIKEIKLNEINWSKQEQSAIYINPTRAKKELLGNSLLKPDQLLLNAEVEDINNNLAKVISDIRNIEKRFELDGIIYSSAMVVDALKGSALVKTKKEEHKNFLYDFMDKYITDHELSREKSSLGVYRSIKNHLHAFQKQTGQHIRFESIDYAFFQQFQNFLIGLKKMDKEENVNAQLNNTTIAKALSTLKTFLGYARKNGIKINEGYRDFSIKRESLEVIALTEYEFSQLQKIDLSKNKRLDQVRDVFCFSCSSGLRISDMEQLKREHIKHGVISIFVKKTKTELTIPLNYVTSSILEKYKENYRPLPIISSQKLNLYLKELCELAGIDEQVEIVRYKGAKRETTTYPKYKLIHLHTGRKTFCTLSLERGMSAEQVMSISGHTDYKSFKRYVNVTEKLKKTVMQKAWGEIQY